MEIKCERLRINYGGNAVINKLNATFTSRAVNVVIGSSGSGKSTLLRTVAALNDPSDGHIYYDGKPHYELQSRDIRSKAGMIFQRPTLFEGTVYDNLRFGLEQQDKQIDDKEIELTLKQVGIPIDYLGKKGDELSVGEQQRICIVRALLPSPDLFLLDEPTSALDPQTSNKVLKLIRRLKTDFNKTVIMVSHDIRESLNIADKVFFLSGGRIAFSGDKSDIEREKSLDDSIVSKFLRGDDG